jgi:hypothetical protein
MLRRAKFLFGITSVDALSDSLSGPKERAPRMRITLALGLSVLLGCGPLLADTVYYRCLKVTNPRETLLVTIDPLLGEMKAEHSGAILRSRRVYQIDMMDEATIRGRYVLPLVGFAMVLELDRVKGRVTETIGGKVPTYYNCEPPSSTL